ncbi:MAG: TMF family protein, partial [Bacteroidota bacterium]
GGQQISVWTTESGGVFYEQGKVRIGDVSTPDGYKLYVEQGLLAERVKISLKSTGDWADYVFAPDYTLPSLPEVEAYIRTHQHLPGIPSAESLVETGIDLGTINAKLLEKIEELTLYVIQQNQELTRLKERQSQLEQALKP